MRSIFLCLFCLISSFCFSQQTEDFKHVKGFYNQHRSMLSNEFKKKFDAEANTFSKTLIRQDFVLFMKKMDSIENVALIGALLKVRNLEDLKKINQPSNTKDVSNHLAIATAIEKTADYPGGINALRKEVSELFYSPGVYSEIKTIKTNVAFIVEKDGSITNVHAQGDNFTFNRQAEIALYSVSEKFSPAVVNGESVRYRFSLPLTMNIDR